MTFASNSFFIVEQDILVYVFKYFVDYRKHFTCRKNALKVKSTIIDLYLPIIRLSIYYTFHINLVFTTFKNRYVMFTHPALVYRSGYSFFACTIIFLNIAACDDC